MVVSSKNEGMYFYGSDTRSTAILAIIKKKTGRKKSGTFKLHLLSGSPDNLPSVAADITVKFISKLDQEPFIDVPNLDDLMYADIPWSGRFTVNDPSLDDKFIFTVNVRNIVRFNKFIFQLRETCDGKLYQDGLVRWTIYNSADGFDYDIKTGLKQTEVVESFQGYYDGIESLHQYLKDAGYINIDKNIWKLIDDGKVISEIDYTLLGILLFEDVNPKSLASIT